MYFRIDKALELKYATRKAIGERCFTIVKLLMIAPVVHILKIEIKM
jgi:hypothetical protein